MNQPRTIKSQEEFLELLQKRIANWSMGIRVFRGRPSGTVADARQFMEKLNLAVIPKTKSGFSKWLLVQTNNLASKLRKANQPDNWFGISRKALNIFLFECSMNKYLSSAYKLSEIEKNLELPIDRLVAEFINDKEIKVKFQSIKTLDKKAIENFQAEARSIAKRFKIKNNYRVYVDLLAWQSRSDDPNP